MEEELVKGGPGCIGVNDKAGILSTEQTIINHANWLWAVVFVWAWFKFTASYDEWRLCLEQVKGGRCG